MFQYTNFTFEMRHPIRKVFLTITSKIKLLERVLRKKKKLFYTSNNFKSKIEEVCTTPKLTVISQELECITT